MTRTAFCIALAMLLAGCSASFRDGLDEGQANEMIVVLAQQGIKASKIKSGNGTWSIKVESDEQVSAEQVVRAYDQPKAKHPSLGDVFPGGSLLPSETDERIRYQYALSQELSQSIEKIDGVLSARVHVAIPEKNPRQSPAPEPSAAAVIRYRSDQRMDLLKPQLKAMIAASIIGASADDVALLMVPVYPVSRPDASQVVQTYAGIRYRASEWLPVALVTGLPWVVAFMLLLMFLRTTRQRGGSHPRRLWETLTGRLRARLSRRRPADPGSDSVQAYRKYASTVPSDRQQAKDDREGGAA